MKKNHPLNEEVFRIKEMSRGYNLSQPIILNKKTGNENQCFMMSVCSQDDNLVSISVKKRLMSLYGILCDMKTT